MLARVIVRVVRACCRFPWFVLVVALIVSAAAANYVRENFAITTNTGQLISERLPWRQREIQFDAAFPQQSDSILIVIDGATPELADSASRALAEALAKSPGQFKSVRQPD